MATCQQCNGPALIYNPQTMTKQGAMKVYNHCNKHNLPLPKGIWLPANARYCEACSLERMRGTPDLKAPRKRKTKDKFPSAARIKIRQRKMVLFSVLHGSTGMRVSELSRCSGINSSLVSGALASYTKTGLVSASEGTTNRYYKLTEKGKSELQTLQEAQ